CSAFGLTSRPTEDRHREPGNAAQAVDLIRPYEPHAPGKGFRSCEFIRTRFIQCRGRINPALRGSHPFAECLEPRGPYPPRNVPDARSRAGDGARIDSPHDAKRG